MRTHREKQKGAAAVEMAMIAPFLIMLLLGTVEFSYKFAQYNEIRHSAREGARFAAVSNAALNGGSTVNNAAVITNACNALNLPSFGTVTVTTTRTGANIGDTATITISAAVGSLSNAPYITGFLPSSLSNTATFRLEQTATWTAGTGTCP